ncbi:hypothetical protein QTG54_012482 [Skeletonema marinoi]|uniref:Uncharacterized protein n=1 Tax=Skeletonema marinoi TaxID=267567 RepID=A0AAD9D7P0_9STRA|nr:hypothetical protein QTG54_012482 [Skeletonema marinoi]
MGIRHRQQAEKKQQKTISEYSKQAIMGYSDDIEQGTNNLRKAHPQVKQIMGSYQVRRRLSLAGIGIALFGAVAVVTFVTMHMNAMQEYLCNSIDHALLPAPTLINIGRAGSYDS